MNLMELLAERRRNPEQNPRINAVDFLRQYKDDPKMYLHTTNIQKVGIYPKSSASHDSPAGIYAYRLMDIWENTIERWNSGEYSRGLEFLPYHGGDHLFVLESDIDPNFPAHYTKSDLARDSAQLKQIYGLSDERLKRLRKTATTNQNFRPSPAGVFWGMVKAFVAGVDEFDRYTWVNTMKWNTVLRKLGYVGFNDPGYGLIHGAEDSQALFLSTTAFRVVDHMMKARGQKTMRIGDKQFRGGRLPRDLFMDGIPNTLFDNNVPADFAKVRTWTVGGMGLRDLHTFARFVPWNGQGIVKTLVIDDGDLRVSTVRVHGFLANPGLPKNIKIDNLYISARFPISLLSYMSADFPVQTITVSAFGGTHGLDKLPPAIQAKVKVV